MRPLSIPSGRRAPGHRGETPRTTEREPRGTRPLTGRREGRAAETEGTVAAGAAYGLPVKKRPRAPFTVHSQSPRLLPVTTGRFTPAGSGKHFGRAQTLTGVLGPKERMSSFEEGEGSYRAEAVTDLTAGRGAGGLEMTNLVVEGRDGQVTRSLRGRKGRNETNKEKEL